LRNSIQSRLNEYKHKNSKCHVYSSIFIESKTAYYEREINKWGFVLGEQYSLDEYCKIGGLIIYGYGTSRKMGSTSLSENENQDNTESLFNDNVTLTNTEEWLLQTYFAEKLDKPNAKETLARIKEVLISGILPDVQDFRFDTTPDFKGFVEIKTDYGWVKLRELGYGYQVTLAWIVDLAKKLFERYPQSKNPLHEPAIVLIDEIDLHLHPEWQRKIIKFLSEQFPKTQFIATTHSPLIVQSAENINLVLLEKEDDHVVINQRNDIKTFKGWTIEEILEELMGLGERTASDDYLKFMRQFDEALDEDDYEKAKNAYDSLDKILHP
jgi:predicted ATP-binding protein involved in virulence